MRPPHSLKYKRNQYIVDQYIAEEDHGERDEEREKFFLGYGVGYLEETRDRPFREEDAEYAEDRDRPEADVTADVAPVPDLNVVVPQAHAAEVVVEDIPCREFDDERADAGDDEDEKRADLPFEDRERQEKRAEAVDRQPRTALTAPYEVPLIDAVEQLLIHPADHGAENDKQDHRDDVALLLGQVLLCRGLAHSSHIIGVWRTMQIQFIICVSLLLTDHQEVSHG